MATIEEEIHQETDEEKEKRYDQIKPYFIAEMASFEGDFFQSDFAKKWNIPETTLSHWKKTKWFKEKYIDAIETNMVIYLKDLYKTAKQKAIDGDYNFTKMILGQLEILKAEKKEKQDTNITVNLVPGYGHSTLGSSQQTGGDSTTLSEIQSS